MSEFLVRPDHAASRPFPRFAGSGTTLPETPSKAPSITPTERPARRFTAASSSSSASRSTARACCSALSGTRRGGNNLTSLVLVLLFANHRRGRQRSRVSLRREREKPPYIERRFQSPILDTPTSEDQPRRCSQAERGGTQAVVSVADRASTESAEERLRRSARKPSYIERPF